MAELLQVWIVSSVAGSEPFYLCSGTRQSSSPDGLKIHGAVQVQSSQRFRAPQKRFRNRLNFEQSISFSTQRLFDDESAAAFYMLLHAVTLPRDGTVYFQQESSSGMIKTVMYNAVISADDESQKGATTYHSYTIVGGGMVAAEN
jgi:hypothetical protein